MRPESGLDCPICAIQLESGLDCLTCAMRPESSFDCFTCAIFARQRPNRFPGGGRRRPLARPTLYREAFVGTDMSLSSSLSLTHTLSLFLSLIHTHTHKHTLSLTVSRAGTDGVRAHALLRRASGLMCTNVHHIRP